MVVVFSVGKPSKITFGRPSCRLIEFQRSRISDLSRASLLALRRVAVCVIIVAVLGMAAHGGDEFVRGRYDLVGYCLAIQGHALGKK